MNTQFVIELHNFYQCRKFKNIVIYGASDDCNLAIKVVIW
jgi:hypothetical protein